MASFFILLLLLLKLKQLYFPMLKTSLTVGFTFFFLRISTIFFFRLNWGIPCISIHVLTFLYSIEDGQSHSFIFVLLSYLSSTVSSAKIEARPTISEEQGLNAQKGGEGVFSAKWRREGESQGKWVTITNDPSGGNLNESQFGAAHTWEEFSILEWSFLNSDNCSLNKMNNIGPKAYLNHRTKYPACGYMWSDKENIDSKYCQTIGSIQVCYVWTLSLASTGHLESWLSGNMKQILHINKDQIKCTSVTNNVKSCEKESDGFTIVSITKLQNWNSESFFDGYKIKWRNKSKARSMVTGL